MSVASSIFVEPLLAVTEELILILIKYHYLSIPKLHNPSVVLISQNIESLAIL